MAVVVRNAKIERLTFPRAEARKVRERETPIRARFSSLLLLARRQADFTEECGNRIVHRRHSRRQITLAPVYRGRHLQAHD